MSGQPDAPAFSIFLFYKRLLDNFPNSVYMDIKEGIIVSRYLPLGHRIDQCSFSLHSSEKRNFF